MELTTVAPDEVVIHDGPTVHRHLGLSPATTYEFDGLTATTLPFSAQSAINGSAFAHVSMISSGG